MYNTNSPIVNNIMGGGNIPPNPIGNIVNMGMGYNMNNPQINNMGGYYNNTYSNYYNPYLIAKQQQMYEAQLKEEQRKQADMMKTLVTKVNKALGQETSEEMLKMYDPVYIQQDDEEATVYKLLEVNNSGLNYNPRLLNSIQYHNQMYEKQKERFPDTMGISEYHDKAGVLYREMLIQQQEEKQKDLSQLYSSEEYRKLLSKYKGTSYFNSIYGGGKANTATSIDDMEIRMPDRIKNEYERRKQVFLESIFNNK